MDREITTRHRVTLKRLSHVKVLAVLAKSNRTCLSENEGISTNPDAASEQGLLASSATGAKPYSLILHIDDHAKVE